MHPTYTLRTPSSILQPNSKNTCIPLYGKWVQAYQNHQHFHKALQNHIIMENFLNFLNRNQILFDSNLTPTEAGISSIPQTDPHEQSYRKLQEQLSGLQCDLIRGHRARRKESDQLFVLQSLLDQQATATQKMCRPIILARRRAQVYVK